MCIASAAPRAPAGKVGRYRCAMPNSEPGCGISNGKSGRKCRCSAIIRIIPIWRPIPTSGRLFSAAAAVAGGNPLGSVGDAKPGEAPAVSFLVIRFVMIAIASCFVG